MITRIAFVLFAAVPLLAHAGDVDQRDRFGGDQVFYELSYKADFYSGLVASLVGRCTNNATPFFIAKLPNPSFKVKQKMLGGMFGFIGFVHPNPYSGRRFGGDSDDPRRPSTASQRVAEEMFVAAQEGNVVGYFCDVHLWDILQDYARAHLALVNFAVDTLAQEQRAGDAMDLLLSVDPLFEKMQRLVNGDPNRERNWRYELSAPTVEGDVTD